MFALSSSPHHPLESCFQKPNVTAHNIWGNKTKQRWWERSQRLYKHTNEDEERNRVEGKNIVQSCKVKLNFSEKNGKNMLKMAAGSLLRKEITNLHIKL
jgi:hypothetical protein